MNVSAAFLQETLASARILLADDSEFMQCLMREMLRAIGVGTVVVASDGRRALSMLEDSQVSCVIADWVMYPVDGYTFLQTLRRVDKPDTARTPVIMCTAHTEGSRVRALRDAGVSEILAKPVAPASLYTKLVTALLHPRPFVRTDDYVGPDRRRQKQPIEFQDRRRGGEDLDLDAILGEVNAGRAAAARS